MGETGEPVVYPYGHRENMETHRFPALRVGHVNNYSTHNELLKIITNEELKQAMSIEIRAGQYVNISERSLNKLDFAFSH